MNAEVIKLVEAGLKALPLKAKIGLGVLVIVGYVGINVVSAVVASNNGQGFENALLRIKIYPKGQDAYVEGAQDASPVAAQGAVV